MLRPYKNSGLAQVQGIDQSDRICLMKGGRSGIGGDGNADEGEEGEKCQPAQSPGRGHG